MKHRYVVYILFGVILIQFGLLLYLCLNPRIEIREKPIFLIFDSESHEIPHTVSRAI